ncbi:MAG: hypothetical protein KIT09_09160 [Bryobacteraceae bacterium]|nr:hypothetical protein [Bryobacteraceae bacterium]
MNSQGRNARAFDLNRRQFTLLLPAAFGLGGDKPPIPEPHFPSRLHQYVWRNWELANTREIAGVIGATEKQVLDIGYSMGLPEKRRLTADQLRRLYITVIRQNWHILPEDQIMRLLGWDRSRFDFTLKEDDFLDVKLGREKPACGELTYRPPSDEERRQAARVRRIVEDTMGQAIHERGQELFHFVGALSDTGYPTLRGATARAAADEIDLTSEWRVERPQQPALARAAERFSRYLRSAMGAHAPVVSPGLASKHVRFRVEGGVAESFTADIGEEEILIAADGEQGAIQAIYWMQDEMEAREGPFLRKGRTARKAVWNPRYLYSYFALYGDPLMEPESDPFPQGYLERLARTGVNGVWMQGVLNTLAPSKRFPEFGRDWQTRLENLNRLVKRAAEFGMKVFLYANEPRAMPAAFFANRPHIRGTGYQDLFAMCTSAPEVRAWIAESMAHVMEHAPELGGWFSITMSENHTNCFSHGGAWGAGAPAADGCPRCSRRASWDVIAELIRTFRDGVRRRSAAAEIIAWDWGWGDALAERLIPLLPRDVRTLSISEWDAPVNRGVATKVGEYSMSVVGPGPRAKRNWERARKHGLSPMAKTQFNATWEISAAPYIPVPQLVVRHCANLEASGIRGVMASWTVGGFPSPNLEAAKGFYFEGGAREDALPAIARRRYGVEAAPEAIKAWAQFSAAFEQFPYGVHVYFVPTQHGPANLLRWTPTGRPPAMILFPHDGLDQWRGPYPAEVMRGQFAKMAAMWREGLDTLGRALEKASPARRRHAAIDLAAAQTCHHHFQSVANQVEFYILREKRMAGDAAAGRRMKQIAEREIELARAQFLVARRESAVGYEASNHYYYTPLDLVEKILNCRHVIDAEG